MASMRDGHRGTVAHSDKGGGKGGNKIVVHIGVGGHVCSGSGVHDPLTDG